MHTALYALNLYQWKQKVHRYIDLQCPHRMRFPVGDATEMPGRILKLFYPQATGILEGATPAMVFERLTAALYPLKKPKEPVSVEGLLSLTPNEAPILI